MVSILEKVNQDCGGLVMDVSYYYQILDIGVLYEKGKKRGKVWRFGERKRLQTEIFLWEKILEYIKLEKEGTNCSENLFHNLEEVCKKYKFPNYERVLKKRNEIISSTCIFERREDEEEKIYSFMNQLLLDMKADINFYGGKENVYRMLAILHNLPKAMHGQNVLNEKGNVISYTDALNYAKGCMNERMQERYETFLKC